MSSFQYTDNFSGFNDLINRSEFLTEAKKSPYSKYHPSFGGVTKDLRSAGFSSAPLDTINFIRTALYNLELISDDELAAAKKGTGFAAKKNNLIALLDAKEDVIEQNKDAIAKEIADGLARYINRATTDRGREEKYAAQKAALELANDIKAGKDVGDAVDDTVDQMSEGEKELMSSIEMAKSDPTHMVVIKVEDESKAEEVKQLISKYADAGHLDVFDNVVQFSSTSDSPLVGAVAEHGIEKIEAALQKDVGRLSNNTVEIISPGFRRSPEEDYERMDDDEMGYGIDEPGGVPGSYAMGEEGGGITEVEDAEDLSAKKARAGKDIGKPGKNFSKIAKSAGKKYGSKAAGERVAGAVLAKMRGNYEGAEDEFDDFDIGPQSDEDVPDDYEEVLKAMVTKDKEDLAKNMIEDEEGGFTKSRVLVAFAPDHSPEEMQANVDRYLAAAEKLGVKARAGKIDDEVAEVYVDAGPASKEMKILGDLQRDMLQTTGYFGGDEAIRMQPMLESHKTNTSVYLTEQTASDKRNKRTETKNQSFKEKYKPKTSWQLEELRHYGL
tara:strand:+ start:4364 stop:6025 length:1662 start_codon:yes stop_codon:yes gene_type:complete